MAIIEDMNDARLFNNKEPIAPIIGILEVYRKRKTQ
jgi:hypothetical protein